jgi:hypothetical protein
MTTGPNSRVRNCRIFHLKTLDPLGLLVVFLRRYPSLQFNHGGIGMNSKLLNCLIAGALSTTLALASPALARGGFGGMGGGHGGGMGGTHFSGGRFAGGPFTHAGFSPRFSRVAFRDHRFIHHRFHRFAFVGAPFAYAAYDGCWRRVWTPYGLQWVDVCGDYGY